MGIILTLSFLATIGLLVWLGNEHSQQLPRGHNLTLFEGCNLFAVVLGVYYWRNFMQARLDRLLLGVGVKRLSRDSQTVTLGFADSKLGAAVVELSSQRRDTVGLAVAEMIGDKG